MKCRNILFAAIALLIYACVSAQDLKPVRDKATKLYGYQDKSKNWVIEPAFNAARRFNGGFAIVEQNGLKGLIDTSGAWVLAPEYDDIGKFDKLGLCEVTVKLGRKKYRGVADRSGTLVLPPDGVSVSIDRSEELILAKREVEVQRAGLFALWGVYGTDGTEYFAPQFLREPSFYRGRGVAQSSLTGLKGIISSDGEVLVPFDNLAISSDFGGYEALSADFVRRRYDSQLHLASDAPVPGYIIPYDPMGDPVRAAAWHKWPVGVRFHRNNLRELVLPGDGRYHSAVCSILPVDWGYERFVRIEPVPDEGEHPFSLLCMDTGVSYTLRATLYERNGQKVSDLSSWGWLEGSCEEGVVYHAEDGRTWLLMRELNAPAIPSFSVPLTGFRKTDNSDLCSALDIQSYEVGRMYDPERAAERYVEIIENENLGITGAEPRPAPERRLAGMLDKAMRAPLFRRPFRIGQVLGCKVTRRGDETEITLSDRLVYKVEDRFSDPSYSFRGEEELYWGPDNDYTLWLSLEPATSAREHIEDDVFGTGRSFVLVLSLYDSRDRFIRTITTLPAPDYNVDGVLVFGKEGIALVAGDGEGHGRPGHHGHGHGASKGHGGHGGDVRISTTSAPLPAKLSVLQEIKR